MYPRALPQGYESFLEYMVGKIFIETKVTSSSPQTHPNCLEFNPQGSSFYSFSPEGLRFSPRGLRFSPGGLRFSPEGLRFSPGGLRS